MIIVHQKDLMIKVLMVVFFTFIFSQAVIPSDKKINTLNQKLLTECQKKNYNAQKIEKLLKKNANPNILIKETPIHSIIKNYQSNLRTHTLKLLLDYKANPTIKNSNGYTPLHTMTEYPCSRVTATLIKGAFEIPTSITEICKKYNECNKIIFCYLSCLKIKKVKIPKYVNLKILYSVFYESDWYTTKKSIALTNMHEFINTSRNTSNGWFSCADVISEDAIEMLNNKFSVPPLGFYHQVLQFLKDLKQCTLYDEAITKCNKMLSNEYY